MIFESSRGYCRKARREPPGSCRENFQRNYVLLGSGKSPACLPRGKREGALFTINVCGSILGAENSRRLELSISKSIPHGRWGQGPGSVDPRFPAVLPFPVPEILQCVAFRASATFFQQFSRDFPGVFLGNPPNRPRKQPQPSRVF